MSLLLHLESILSDFRFMFNSQNFALFQAFLYGFMTDTGRGTVTQLYQSSASQTRYGSFPKFLSRGNWDSDAVAAHLIRYIQGIFETWVYVYDETRALKTAVRNGDFTSSETSVIKNVASMHRSFTTDMSLGLSVCYVRPRHSGCCFRCG